MSRNPLLKALTVNNSVGALRMNYKCFPSDKKPTLHECLRNERICCLVGDLFKTIPGLAGVFDEIRFSNMVQEFHYSPEGTMRMAIRIARKALKGGGRVVVLDNQVDELDEIVRSLNIQVSRHEVNLKSGSAKQTEYYEDLFPYVKYVIQ